jgi:hypothetical protein
MRASNLNIPTLQSLIPHVGIPSSRDISSRLSQLQFEATDQALGRGEHCRHLEGRNESRNCSEEDSDSGLFKPDRETNTDVQIPVNSKPITLDHWDELAVELPVRLGVVWRDSVA